ncbi:unnamed protein product [Ectocarpus sp. 4 AP-2014]
MLIKDCSLKLKSINFSSMSKIVQYNKKEASVKRGNVYLKSTNKNIFCILLDAQDKKVKTSCSLRVPEYENEFNERENVFKRGILLGELFGDKVENLGYTEIVVYLDFNINKGRKGVMVGLRKKKVKISLIQLLKGYPHNGCRPSKIRRKKIRTKPKNL